MAANIRDVARLAGVSAGTVSRVIHNQGYISRVTKKRVQEAIHKLDYYPNAVASRLALGKTHIIGLLAPNFQELYYIEITDAIIAAARKAGYSVLVNTTQGDSSHLPEFLRNGNMDGLLVITPYYVEDVLAGYLKRDLPCVMLNYAAESQVFSSVYCDQFRVGYLATQHLIDLGHRRIGFCTSDTSSPSPMKRLQGCLQALTDAKLAVNGSDIRDMSQKQQKDPVAEIRAWIREGDLPTAMFVFSDDIALYVMDALKDAGKRIPQDVSVIGCGNLLFSKRTIPPLTTVDQHTYEMGNKSMEILLHAIEAETPTPPKIHVIEPRVILRESCRAASSSES
ncbi:transcriptional regulator, LacI family [Candidatus Moduliflexus flocculans]|uniref:Transcriptional regulator, LacI family n=1 Tax=Candidatus Moduliflexus flocculans TaxID=1499966 RepID=A0A0S6VSQ4_9BACT|nr:transcriptional regulator, LacI family [Candidatus Moduliflexus flocculans]